MRSSLNFLALLLLLLSASAWKFSDIDTDDDDGDDNGDGELDPTDLAPRTLGQRCGKETNQCEQGLDCVRMALRRRCAPVTCAVNAFQTAIDQSGFDLKGYGKMIMEKAGVNTSELFWNRPDRNLNLMRNENNSVRRTLETMERNQPPIRLLMNSFNNCTRQSNSTQAVGATPYFGASWELGALATYNADIFWAQGTEDPVGFGIMNNCFGAVLGIDAAISGLLGIAFTPSVSQLSDGCKQMFPIFAFPPFELQIGFAGPDMSSIPTLLVEMTGGGSASSGLPGYTQCNTLLL